jgi:nicotinate dehydrogenase subunit B
MKRREFVKLAGGGVFVFFTVGEPWEWLEAQQRPGGRDYPTDFNAYLRIAEDGKVTGFSGKAELGQGTQTALAQILAEELDVPLDRVDVIMGDTALCPWDMGTFGSRSIKYFGPALRQAGAEARAVLVELASEPKSPVKPPAEYTIVGRPADRKDALLKVTGKSQYAADIRLPGQLYARILRPPVHGAKLRTIDLSGAEKTEGARVIQDGDLIAVLHSASDLAEAALSKIKVEWDVPEGAVDEETIYEHLVKVAPAGDVVEEKGSLEEGRKLAATVFEESYFTPYVAHAPVEPHTAAAKIEGDSATVWASTQRPFGAKDEVVQALGLAPEKVRAITPFVGGGFGGKNSNRQAVEAARLAKLAGAPVQVVGSRSEEFFYDTFQPAAVIKIVSGLDAANKLVLWDYDIFFAGERTSQPFYDIPHYRILSRGSWGRGGAGGHPFAVGAWRAPGSNTNTFAREVHMDAMAAKAGLDPLEFRLLNLKDERMKRALAAVADNFGWKPAKTPSGRGVGVACVNYLNTYVATMAEVEVDKSGAVKVRRVVCAQDMGRVINPDGARAQMEGCITMGLGYCLREEIHFRGGDIRDRNFDSYEIPRFSWLPKIETILVDNPGLEPQGGGEPGIVNMGAVVANAVFDATGARLKRLPITPARLKASLPPG